MASLPNRLFFAALLVGGAAAAADLGGYAITARHPMAGEGGWDYLSHDTGHNRLYVSRATRVQVVDTLTGQILAEIADTPGVHGIALASDLNKGYISSGRANAVRVVDLQSMKSGVVIATPQGENPDYITYDASTQRVWAFNGRSKNASVLDARTDQLLATVPLSGKPEAAVADGRGHVFVDIEDRNEVAVLDAAGARVTTHFALPGCDEPAGLAIDAAQRRLFVGCHNKLLLVLNSDSGAVVAKLPIGEGVDAMVFDVERHLVFSSQNDGSLTIIQALSADEYKVIQTVSTPLGARTMALNAKTHEVYLMAAEYDELPASAPQLRPRRVMRPGSAQLLVVAPRP
jgi:DNA-binding beta-propeller fold protein YncE